MGALHDGHAELLRRARAENDHVVMSLFVNPAQFDEAADLAAYPRTEAADAAIAEAAGVDIVFAPGAGGGLSRRLRDDGQGGRSRARVRGRRTADRSTSRASPPSC